jgi:hypothetical protein
MSRAALSFSASLVSGAPVAEPDPMMAARRAYEDSSESLRSIADRLGITHKQLRLLAERSGWRLRPPQTPEERRRNFIMAGIAASRRRAAARRAAPPQELPPAADRLGLVKKLRTAVEREIAVAEKRLKQNAGGAGIERAARTLASLVRTLRELRALEAEAEPDEAEEVPRDADELRRALAERLDRLGRQGDG